MPTFQEQQAALRALRQTRDRAGDRLYEAQIRLLKAEDLLQAAKRKERSAPPGSQASVLKRQIAGHEAELRVILKAVNDTSVLRGRLHEAEQRVQFLKQRAASAEAQQTAARRLFQEVENRDRVKADALRDQLRSLQDLQDELDKSGQAAQSAAAAARRELDRATAAAGQAQQRAREVTAAIAGLQRQLAGQLAPQVPSPASAEGSVKELQAQVDARQKDRLRARDALHQAVATLYGDVSPTTLVEKLSDGTPFLLLPVRIETRFMPADNGTELWVRIYPDDIAVHTHEATLTDREAAQGKTYWTAIYTARTTGGEGEEDALRAAWTALVAEFGSQRAAWVAVASRPSNWSDDLSGIPSAEDLVFPPVDLTKQNSWTRAPRTTMLPDKFVVMLLNAETIVHQAEGALLPDELILGPDPLDANASFQQKGADVAFGTEFEWMSDFDKAVEKGMAVRIPISPAEAQQGFDRIEVLGLMLSADAEASAGMLSALIDNHHYSPKGFALVPQGTATNNTEEDGSGYTTNDQFNDVSYVVEAGDPLFDQMTECDGRALADALGIPLATLQHVLHADGTDGRQAMLMNRALYAATMGFAAEALLAPVLSDAATAELQEFMVQHVTGRGPLSAIRVGNQPYGVLLTSDFSAWRPTRDERPFYLTLQAVLAKYEALWQQLVPALSHVGMKGKTPSEVMMNVLGLQPGSVSFAQRIGYSTDYLRNLDDFQYGGRYAADATKNFDQKNIVLNQLAALGYALQDDRGNLRVPQILRLIYQHYTTGLDAANLVDGVPLSEKDRVRPYDAGSGKNYLQWLSEAPGMDALEKQDFGAGNPAPTALLYLQLRRALLLQLHKASVQWADRNGVLLTQTLQPANFLNIRPGGDLTKYEVLRTTVGTIVPAHPQKAMMLSEYLLTAGRSEDEAAILNAMRTALAELAKASTAELERCFTEHLDCCTYRLDAWQTGLFHRRLQRQRAVSASADGAQQKPGGIFLGAYGWVEDVRPAARKSVDPASIPEGLRPPKGTPLVEFDGNGGFVHAPSLNHASTAAVLRSGYLTHASAGAPETMAVNLSSERVRRALFVIEGVRNGQPLEALLGYQFERGLHDRGSALDALKKLNLYVYDFRDAFPYEQHVVRQQGTPPAASETIPAASVVNGVTLAESTKPFPYGATGDVAAASSDERTAIEEEKNTLADTLDAVKDLLLAESTFQMIQGNFDRSGAVMAAMKDANVLPELQVIDTPRGSQFTFMNRVTLQFSRPDPDLPEGNPWSPIPMSPRARMETGVNVWLESVLGTPETIVFEVCHVDADGNELDTTTMNLVGLGLQPIDLVYIAGTELNTGAAGNGGEPRTGLSELEARIAFRYRMDQGLDDAAPVTIRFLKPDGGPGRPLGVFLPLLRSLKSLLTDSRPLQAEDFAPPARQSRTGDANPQGYDDGELGVRIQAARQVFDALLSELALISVTAMVKDAGGITQTYTAFGPACAALETARLGFADVPHTLSTANADHLQSVLQRLSLFGVSDAFPHRLSTFTDDDRTALLDQARSIARSAATASAAAAKAANDAAGAATIAGRVEKLSAARMAILGDVFTILPSFTYKNEADILQSHAEENTLLSYARSTLKMPRPTDEWLHSAGRVRPKAGRWDMVRLLAESLAKAPLELATVQVPYRAEDRWIAVEYPALDPLTGEPFTIKHDTLSIVIHGDAAFAPGAKRSGLLVDDWTESIPGTEEVTGVTFHYDQPSAAPPQTLLLVVTPQEKGHWTWADLTGTLRDTLARAKRRAVEPLLLDTLNAPEYSMLFPALVAEFSQVDLNIALDYRLNVAWYASAIPITSTVTLQP